MFFVLRWGAAVAAGRGSMTTPARRRRPRRPAPVTVLIPAHNEAEVIIDTLLAACRIDYPRFRIVVVDDGSTDATARRSSRSCPPAACAWCANGSTGQGDGAQRRPAAVPWRDRAHAGRRRRARRADPAPHRAPLPRRARRRGDRQPRVRNAVNFLARLRAIEFSSIVSLLRRSQRVWGRVVTVSGVVAAFRRERGARRRRLLAGHADRGHRAHLEAAEALYDVRYEPRAIVWMTVRSRSPACTGSGCAGRAG